MEPCDFINPITSKLTPAIEISLFKRRFLEVLSSFGTEDPNTTTLFLDKSCRSENKVPSSSSYPLISKKLAVEPIISRLTLSLFSFTCLDPLISGAIFQSISLSSSNASASFISRVLFLSLDDPDLDQPG